MDKKESFINSAIKVHGHKYDYSNDNYYIGRYITEEEAALAYNKKALELFKEFAKLNIIK